MNHLDMYLSWRAGLTATQERTVSPIPRRNCIHDRLSFESIEEAFERERGLGLLGEEADRLKNVTVANHLTFLLVG